MDYRDYQSRRGRSPLLEQILRQMQQTQQFQPQSYGALAAALGAQYLNQRNAKKERGVMEQAQMGQNEALAAAMGGRAQSVNPADPLTPDPAEAKQMNIAEYIRRSGDPEVAIRMGESAEKKELLGMEQKNRMEALMAEVNARSANLDKELAARRDMLKEELASKEKLARDELAAQKQLIRLKAANPSVDHKVQMDAKQRLWLVNQQNPQQKAIPLLDSDGKQMVGPKSFNIVEALFGGGAGPKAPAGPAPEGFQQVPGQD